MVLRKFKAAEIQLNRAITIFLKEDDYISALTLAGASEEILGKQLSHTGKESAFSFLHKWYQEEKETKMNTGEFSNYANWPRNTLKHFTDPEEDPIEIFRWETIQILMRAIGNYYALSGQLTPQMKEFQDWIDKHKDIFETLE